MSAPHSPELQQEQGQNPEALQAERLSAQLAYETLYTAENRLIPTIDQLKVVQEWVSGVHSFDQQGNALDDKGNLLMNAGSYAFVRGYFSDRNWLLGEHEQDALARFIHKPRHAKDFELDTEHLPPVFAREVEAKLGPSSTPEEKHARAEKVARLREDSKQLLTLHEDVVAKATTERTDALKRQLEADAAHILQREYDYRLPHYVSQIRTQHPDFDQLDAVQQAELMQQASARAEADAILIKESHVHRQMQRAGDQTPTAVATMLESVDTSSGKRVKQLEDALEGLRIRGLDKITTTKELDKALYVKPGQQSGDRTAALLDFLPPELRQIATLPDPVEVLAKQSRLQLRSSRNKAADIALGGEITFRNAQLERTLEALKNYRDSLKRDLAFYAEGHSFERFATIKDKVLDALENTAPTPKLSPESLAAFLASSEYAPRALELTLQQGRTDNYMLERELNISEPRREQLVADMVAAGLLSPERRGGGVRHIMVASIDAFLPEPTAVEQPQPEQTTPPQAAIEVHQEPARPKTATDREPQRLTDLRSSEIRDIRQSITERIKEHLAWILEGKRDKLGKPNATLSRQEEEHYAKEAYDEAIEEQVVKAYGINDRDPSYAQAIKDGVEALRYDLEKLRVRRASDVFRDIVRHAGQELTEAALQKATSRYLGRLPVEDRETFVVVFGQLAKEVLAKKTAAKPMQKQPTPSVTSETRAERSARLRGGRKTSPSGTPTPKDAVEANAWKTAIEA